ncbi:MAG: aldo/keto reductase [Halobacteriovoraceae bacterium]|nr:aldo/keto reductase [Halobacteriovoraceae bacterium]
MGLPTSIKKFPLGFGGGGLSINNELIKNSPKEMTSIGLLHHAFEKGFRLFDTAPFYGSGTSEICIGEAFKHIRDKVFIISKSGVVWDQNKIYTKTNDPKITEKMLHQSLKNLNTDYIDLYMVHWPDKNIDIRLTLEVYADALEKGVIRHIGLCNTNKDDLKKAQEVVKIDAVQSEFNLLNRKPFTDIQNFLRENDISFISWGTLDKGILAGQFNRNDKSKVWWKRMDVLEKIEKIENIHPYLLKKYKINKAQLKWTKKILKKMRKLKKIQPLLEKYQITELQLALAHNLAGNEPTISLCGISNKEQLNQLVDSLDNIPSKEVIYQALSILDSKGL